MVLLQLVASAALPSADALLEAETVGLTLHIESPHNEDCPTSHDHVVCQVVRSLAAASARDEIGTEIHVDPPVALSAAIVHRDDPEGRPHQRGPTTPRPPPLG